MEGSHSKRSVQTRFINFFRGLLKFSTAEHFLASLTYLSYLFSLIKPNFVILDIGANIGFTTLNFAMQFIELIEVDLIQYSQSSESLVNLVRELGYRVFDAKTRKVFVVGSWSEVETGISCIPVDQEIF